MAMLNNQRVYHLILLDSTPLQLWMSTGLLSNDIVQAYLKPPIRTESVVFLWEKHSRPKEC